jgi:hypothetical protein
MRAQVAVLQRLVNNQAENLRGGKAPLTPSPSPSRGEGNRRENVPGLTGVFWGGGQKSRLAFSRPNVGTERTLLQLAAAEERIFWGRPQKSPFLAPQKSQKSRREGATKSPGIAFRGFQKSHVGQKKSQMASWHGSLPYVGRKSRTTRPWRRSRSSCCGGLCRPFRACGRGRGGAWLGRLAGWLCSPGSIPWRIGRFGFR